MKRWISEVVNGLIIAAILSSVWILPWYVIAGGHWCGRNHPLYGAVNLATAKWMLGLK